MQEIERLERERRCLARNGDARPWLLQDTCIFSTDRSVCFGGVSLLSTDSVCQVEDLQLCAQRVYLKDNRPCPLTNNQEMLRHFFVLHIVDVEKSPTNKHSETLQIDPMHGGSH